MTERALHTGDDGEAESVPFPDLDAPPRGERRVVIAGFERNEKLPASSARVQGGKALHRFCQSRPGPALAEGATGPTDQDDVARHAR